MPRRLTSSSVNAIVQHALAEIRMGAPVEHAIREAALMGVLYGGGVSEQQAIRQVEAQESTLLRMGPYEQQEARQMGFHVNMYPGAVYPGTQQVPWHPGWTQAQHPGWTQAQHPWTQAQHPYYGPMPGTNVYRP